MAVQSDKSDITGVLGGTTMSVVRDPDARWRASAPTARRGRKHARARVLPVQALIASCLASVFWGVFIDVAKRKK